MRDVIWTEYLKYRAELRGFELDTIESIVRYGDERYFDTITSRMLVVGKHGEILVTTPYETNDDGTATPITIHATNRQQINHRLKSRRYRK